MYIRDMSHLSELYKKKPTAACWMLKQRNYHIIIYNMVDFYVLN